MASHTLNDEEYNTLVSARRNAEQRAADLEAQLAAAKLDDPANRIRPLVALARAQLIVTRFAVANLTPETTRGWPTSTLREIADLLAALPDSTADDRELAITLRHFATEADNIAVFRQEERQRKLVEDAQASTVIVEDTRAL